MTATSIVLNTRELAASFPFHFLLNRHLRFVAIGGSLARLSANISNGDAFSAHMTITRPECELSFDVLRAREHGLFVLRPHHSELSLRGQLLYLSASDCLLFLGSPWVTDLAQLSRHGFTLGDFAIHDPMTDLLVLLQSKNAAAAEAASLAQRLERQRLELHERNAALQESERRYRSVVDNVKEVIFQTDATGAWTLLNRSWTEITGYEIHETLGTCFLDYVHSEDRERNLAYFKPLIAREKDCCRHQVRYRTKSGGYRWIEAYARLTVDGAGQVLGTSGTLNDVTDRHEAEQALRASEARFQAFMDNSPVLAFIKSGDGRFVYVNRPFARRFNASPQELVGRADSSMWPAATAAARREHDALVLAGDEMVSIEEALPAPHDDRTHWLSMKFPLRYPSGERVLACIAVDVSERHYYERQLETYQIQLEKMIASLEQLSLTDSLTRVHNKGYLSRHLEESVERARRYDLPLSMLLLDIDSFKAYNDCFGHLAGDEVLKAVARLLAMQARASDHVARFGGEEFAVVMPNTPIEGAFIVAERIRRAIELAPWPERRVTVSVGVAALEPRTMDGASLIAAADAALYEAKAAGRNRVCRSSRTK